MKSSGRENGNQGNRQIAWSLGAQLKKNNKQPLLKNYKWNEALLPKSGIFFIDFNCIVKPEDDLFFIAFLVLSVENI